LQLEILALRFLLGCRGSVDLQV